MFKLPLAALLAFAFTLAAEDYPKPILYKVAGSPVTATWPSGNVAELKLNRNPLIRIKTPFQVTENLCGGREGQTFNLLGAYRLDRMRWIWIKHRDPAKLGKQVNYRGSTDTPFEFLFRMVNPSAMLLPGNKSEFPRDVMEIEDASWLPDLTITTWSVETMRKNPQTGVSENRVTAELGGVQLVREDASHIRVDALDSFAVIGFEFGLPAVGDVVSWIFARPTGACSITMKPDIGEVRQQITKYIENINQDFTTYNWAQDGLSALVEDNFLLFDFLEYADD